MGPDQIKHAVEKDSEGPYCDMCWKRREEEDEYDHTKRDPTCRDWDIDTMRPICLVDRVKVGIVGRCDV